jgi:hypothetical protein
LIISIFGKEFLKGVSKRLIAYLISLLATATPFLAQIGLNITIDDTKLTEYFIVVVTSLIAYITAETKRPSVEKK